MTIETKLGDLSSGNGTGFTPRPTLPRSDVQAAIEYIMDNVQAYDALLASIAGLTFGSDNYIYGTGSDTAAVGTITTAGRALVDDADTRAQCNTLGTWYVFQHSAVAVSHTGDTSETTLATVTIPANALGPNGRIRWRAHYGYTNSANNKTPRVRWGGASGTIAMSATLTTTAQITWQGEIANRNNAAVQVYTINPGAATGGWGSSNSATGTDTKDTTGTVDIVFSGQLANAGETITLESYEVEILYKA